jgi:hypothetical protein
MDVNKGDDGEKWKVRVKIEQQHLRMSDAEKGVARKYRCSRGRQRRRKCALVAWRDHAAESVQ